jgi:hypothetical protein
LKKEKHSNIHSNGGRVKPGDFLIEFTSTVRTVRQSDMLPREEPITLSCSKLGMVVHSCNTSILEAEAEESSLKPACVT